MFSENPAMLIFWPKCYRDSTSVKSRRHPIIFNVTQMLLSKGGRLSRHH
jgi:hypothetical protein